VVTPSPRAIATSKELPQAEELAAVDVLYEKFLLQEGGCSNALSLRPSNDPEDMWLADESWPVLHRNP